MAGAGAKGRLVGRVAVVTGASSGVGDAIARLFAAEGAQIVAVARGAATLLAAHEGQCGIHALAADIADPAAAGRIVAEAVGQFGRLDIVVNAAGLFELAAVEEIDQDHWDRTFATNVYGPMRLCQAAIPHLKASGAGRIVNIGSVAARLTQAGMGAYTASKHAISGLTLSLAVELGRYRITANVIHPGTILTSMTRGIVADPGLRRYFERKTAVGRLGEADEIAHAALYFADPQSGYTTGQALAVDGGYTAGVNDGPLDQSATPAGERA